MAASPPPSEIAREVLLQLASQRLPPTPDNFRRLYYQVAGTPDPQTAAHEKLLFALSMRLPADKGERQRHHKALQRAIAENKTAEAEKALLAYVDALANEAALNWNGLIRKLMRQWETRQLDWTPARKRESLERVLVAQESETLFARLEGLLKAWSEAPLDPETTTTIINPALMASYAEDEPAPPLNVSAAPAVKLLTLGDAEDILDEVRGALITTLSVLVPALLSEHPDLSREAQGFAVKLKSAERYDQVKVLHAQLRKFGYKLAQSSSDNLEIRDGLENLLRLLLENIEEIVIDDSWLQGQVETVRDVLEHPVTLRQIDDAERRLKDLIFKQSQLKHNLQLAQEALRELLTSFMDQLGELSATTGQYHESMAESAERIALARDLTEISPVLDQVLRDTQSIQTATLRSQQELEEARSRVESAETQMQQMQQELEETSRLMRHDQLTGALNRRGLEEIFEKEISRAQRQETPICVALLDIDNFKRLNDTYGHRTGDEALIHLTQVIRANLRPNDTAGRLGGEEFVIVYPEIELEAAQQALVRLQRELTKTYFLADDQKLLITFSAGVTAWQPGEAMDAAINRADQAMYLAKHSGKNKVVAQ